MSDIDISMNGSCWDEGPSMVRPGECDPMPPRCELRAGHLGAHRSGLSEWMRNEHSYNYVAGRLREAEAVIEEVRANAVELLDADDDSYDGSLSAIWAVELIDAYKTTKTESTDRENGSER